MTTLTKERKGEIALLFFKRNLRESGLRLSENTKREIINNAKKCDVPEEEALALTEELVRELVDETFKK